MISWERQRDRWERSTFLMMLISAHHLVTLETK